VKVFSWACRLYAVLSCS